MTQEEGWAKLGECRRRIDELDVEILKLINERTRIVEQIGQVKQELRMAIYEPKREEAVFANVLSHNGGPLPGEAVKRIFERVIDEMRNVQKVRMQEAAQAETEC